MKPSVAAKLASLVSRARELDALLSDPDVTANLDNYRKLTKEHADIAPVVGPLRRLRRGRGATSPPPRRWRRTPRCAISPKPRSSAGRDRLEEIAADIQKMLLPKDPNDEKNLFLEIRAGTGGDEAALFARDLYGMYRATPRRNRWKVEIISESRGELGGFKEIIARIEGEGVYSRLQFESGGHRVQRVPETETQGRIHTSAATVAVMPEPEDVRNRDQARRLPHRHLPRQRPRRPARQQDRLRRPPDALRHRHRRPVPGREEPAQEPRRPCACSPRASRTSRCASSRRSEPTSARAWSAPATAASASAPTTSPRTASPTTASTSRSTSSTASWPAISTS